MPEMPDSLLSEGAARGAVAELARISHKLRREVAEVASDSSWVGEGAGGVFDNTLRTPEVAQR